jgi:hypothetical protein
MLGARHAYSPSGVAQPQHAHLRPQAARVDCHHAHIHVEIRRDDFEAVVDLEPGREMPPKFLIHHHFRRNPRPKI